MISIRRLKDIREDNDISQEKIANILGVKRSAYSLWELGINIIPLTELCKFADFFYLNIDYILGLTNKKINCFSTSEFSLITLGGNLRNTRIKNNLSQSDVAHILGVSQACIAKYEKGIISISIYNLYKYSKLFNISIDELCERSEVNSPVNI